MKIIQFINNNVVDIVNARQDVTLDNLALVDVIPEFEPREGFSGILKYDKEAGLYWDYELAPICDNISGDELEAMIEEVL